MNYAKIIKYDIANGNGVRTSLFVSGCEFYCKDCFNSIAWDYEYGQKYTEDTHNQIINFVANPNVGGLSILGGDPIWQDSDGIDALIKLCKDVHNIGKTVWLWSGFVWEQIFSHSNLPIIYKRQELIKNCDVFIDGLFQTEKKDLRLKWRGSSNQRVIDVQKSIAENKIVLYED